MRSVSSNNYRKTLLAGSAAVATILLSLATASAQSGAEGSASGLTPEQRSAIRAVVKERLSDEMRDGFPDGLPGAPATATHLTAGKGNRTPRAIQAKPGAEARPDVADRLV